LLGRSAVSEALESAGFGVGQEYEVEVEAGKLTIQAV